MSTLPDLGQNGGPDSAETLEWFRDVIDAVLEDGIMPPPPIPIDPGVLDRLVAFLITAFQGLGPIVNEAEAPDLAEHPA